METQATTSEAAATAAVERKQRKRLQNRLNQRARRVRVNGPNNTKRQRPFQTDRWRLDEIESETSNSLIRAQLARRRDGIINNTSVEDSSSLVLPISDQELCVIDVVGYGQRLQSLFTLLSPHSDHLLHLVNYNAYRGFFTNKHMLSQLTTHFLSATDQTNSIDIMKCFPAQTIIIPSAPNLPPSLVPTLLQRNTLHATWIDLIPFPKVRDNLILQHNRFNHAEFMRDVIGDLLDKWMFPGRGIGARLQGTTQLKLEDGLDDELTANRTGLILWGEPFRPEAWEVTPGFLRKWDWAVEGCDELIRFTNRWRILRGEDAIQSERTL